MIAAVLALGGVACTVFAARSLSRSDAQKSHEAFTQASNQIASTLQLALAREQDLVVSASVFGLENPSASNADFKRWARQQHPFERYPELSAIARIAFVPRSRLREFEARAVADPVGPVRPGGVFTIVPAGVRPFYCFVLWSQTRGPQSHSAASRTPAGTDYCAVYPQLIASRASGQGYDFAISLLTLSNTPLVAIETPVYRGGGMPTTGAGRRAAFLGWTGIVIEPQVLLRSALRGHPGLAVALQDTRGSHLPAFTAGTAPPGAARMTTNLHDGATVKTYGTVGTASVLANSNSRALLFGGALLSAVLFLLALVLLTGRARALRLVFEKTEQLSFQAMHDGLTDLPNRALVLDRAELMLARARRLNTPIAMMFIDVDGFKHVNDTFGHAAGDELLRIIANRLATVVRETDTVGRLGGDEFVVLVEGETLSGGPELVAERALAVLRQPVELDGALGRPQSCSVSIGIAVGQRLTADELLRDADLAMYQAKQAGKDRYVLFEQSMQTDLADRLELEIQLGDALANDELYLLYQPTFDLRTQVVTGVEALIRWDHPGRGVVEPGVFIPLAEENAMIVPIGRWVLEQACEQAAIWHAAGHTIGMAVNVSARQLEHDHFVGEVQAALDDSGLAPEALTLEITETVLMRDPTAAASRLNELKALGVRIAIDDFGTGYSSLAYLRQFPVDAIKIDRSFITGISSSREAGALMHTLIQLGKTLGLETLGEGIEEHAQLEQLKREECDSGQGFLFARPLDVGTVTRFLDRDRVMV
ncbi:MAG: putative bifunctional diguanylate cyclase/phosphodiesterase [Solirubrobacteraceae bacterium]